MRYTYIFLQYNWLTWLSDAEGAKNGQLDFRCVVGRPPTSGYPHGTPSNARLKPQVTHVQGHRCQHPYRSRGHPTRLGLTLLNPSLPGRFVRDPFRLGYPNPVYATLHYSSIQCIRSDRSSIQYSSLNPVFDLRIVFNPVCNHRLPCIPWIQYAIW